MPGTPVVLHPGVSGLPLSGSDYNDNWFLIEQSFLDQGPYVISGLVPTAQPGVLGVAVSAGTAVVGAHMIVPTFNIAPLAPNNTNYLYLLENGQGTSNTTGIAPAASVLLGTATTGPATVTSVATGRNSGRQQFLQPQNLIPGGPAAGLTSAGHLASINLNNWAASPAEGVAVYGVLPGGALPAETDTLAGLTDVSLAGVAQGDILYRGAATWNNLAHGALGAVLASQGMAANPAWSSIFVITATGQPSCPGSGVTSEQYGAGSSVGATTQSVAIGNGAVVSGNTGTAIGFGALAGLNSTAIGELSGDAVANCVWIGQHSGAGGIAGCICIGVNTNDNTQAGQFVAGSDAVPITDIYWGKGVVTGNQTGASITIHGTDGSGTNIGGANVTLAGGRSTGNVGGGSILFQTSPLGVSGSGQNALVTVGSMLSTGQVAIGSQTPTALLHLAAGGGGAGFAPLKFTTSALLVTPESGAMEYRSPSFFVTPVTNHRGISMSGNIPVADQTVANTVTETTLYTGIISANEMNANMAFRVTVLGRYSALVADHFTLNFKQGGTTFLSIASAAATVTNAYWKAEFIVVCRTTGAAGTVISTARLISNNLTQSAADTGTHTLDTTAAQNITITVTWSAASASDTITATQFFMEVLSG